MTQALPFAAEFRPHLPTFISSHSFHAQIIHAQAHGAFETVMVFLAPYLHSYQFLYADDFSLFMPDEVCLPLNTQRRSPPLLKPKALPHVLCVLKCVSHACVFIHSYSE